MKNSITSSDEFALALEKMKACTEAREWAAGLDYDTAWNTCHKPDWLFFLIHKVTPLSSIQNELLICRFAREVVHLLTDPRVLACIEVREAWARGEVSDELREAAREDARAAAWAAAWAATEAASRAAVRATAEDAAEDAAWGAAEDAAEASGLAAAESKQCDIIRELIPQPELV